MTRVSHTLALLAILASACTSAGTDLPLSSTTINSTVASTITSSSILATTTTVVGRSVRTFDVGGVEVIAVTETSELPDQATTIEVTTTLIDSGDGPKLCLGVVADSLPPQCGGPIVDGLDMVGWTEEAQSVRWGERTVVVTWPPVDDHIQLISDREAEFLEYVYPPGELPTECEGIETFVGPREIHDYARGLGERSGGVYLTNDGVIVLQVTDDLQPHRDALGAGGKQACVIEVELSETEQRAIHDELYPELDDVVYGGSVSSTGSGGKVEVGIPVADRDTVEAIAALVDDPSAIRVIGWAILLDD